LTTAAGPLYNLDDDKFEGQNLKSKSLDFEPGHWDFPPAAGKRRLKMAAIKVGVVGSGFIGPAHVEALRRLGNIKVVALAEANQKLADEKAAQLNIPKGYGDFRQLIADPDIVAVHNCTPNALHFKINQATLEAGKHCISEKPLAMTTKESSALVKLAKKKRHLVNAVNFNYRMMPLPQEARQMVKTGQLGDIRLITGQYLQDWLLFDTDFSWRIDPKRNGPSRAFADIGSHWCDMVQFVTGLKIVRVMADLVIVYPNRRKPLGDVDAFATAKRAQQRYQKYKVTTEDFATVMLEFDNGARGVVTVTQISPGRKNFFWFEIDGAKASVRWNQEKPNEMWTGHREKANCELLRDPSLLSKEAAAYAHYPGGHNEGYPDGPKNMFRNIYARIAGDKKALPFPTFQDGHNELAICEAALKSSKLRKWVDVKY